MLPETLAGGRFTLRPFRALDAEDVFAYASDDEFLRYLPIPKPYTRESATQFLARQAARDPGQRVDWAIDVAGRACGGVNIRFVVERRVGEIGYAVARSCWGQGLATDASRLVVGSAFRTYPELFRVRATADARNAASIRVMEKLGMRREGLLRSERPCRGELTDQVVYGVLRSEWRGAGGAIPRAPAPAPPPGPAGPPRTEPTHRAWRAPAFEIRRASAADAAAIAAAHRDSIRSIGPRHYPAETVSEWAAGVAPSLYTAAMEQGEAFFVAIDESDGPGRVLGFSTHRKDGDGHGTTVYVRGDAERRGVGSALFRAAEADARAAGAASLDIDASLAAVEFYKKQGFVETGRGEHALPSGHAMRCVFLRKRLARS
jgi:RimJ/RimL family protein N-acetyltransferase/ribosomal protein S18 acetylase RimI-like enzyme